MSSDSPRFRTANSRAALIAGATAVVLCATGSQAFALDAYRDRTGLFYGGNLGFGAGKPDTAGAENKAGLNFGGRVGGGINQNLTLDFDLGMTRQLGVSNSLLTGFVGANVFPAGDLYVRLMGGIAYASFEDVDGSTGFGAGAGVGYEFWANADMAVGVGVDFQHHFYDSAGFNALNLGLTFTVY